MKDVYLGELRAIADKWAIGRPLHAKLACDFVAAQIVAIANGKGVPAIYREGNADMSSTYPSDIGVWERDYHAWVEIGGAVFDAKAYILRRQKYVPIYKNYVHDESLAVLIPRD